MFLVFSVRTFKYCMTKSFNFQNVTSFATNVIEYPSKLNTDYRI